MPPLSATAAASFTAGVWSGALVVTLLFLLRGLVLGPGGMFASPRAGPTRDR